LRFPSVEASQPALYLFLAVISLFSSGSPPLW
jgi:hypothetical protein